MVGLAVAGLGVSATVADVSPGKSSAFASIVEQNPLPEYGTTPLVSATINKARAKRVLSIHATLTVRGAGAAVVGILPRVNGVSAEPSRITTDCSQQTECSVSGSWYLDVDAAETANPDAFVGEPLLIELLGGETSATTPAVPWDASLSVLMVKK
jgi:hypothetical protein